MFRVRGQKCEPKTEAAHYKERVGHCNTHPQIAIDSQFAVLGDCELPHQLHQATAEMVILNNKKQRNEKKYF